VSGVLTADAASGKVATLAQNTGLKNPLQEDNANPMKDLK